MGNAGSALVKILGIGSAVVLLALGAGVVYGELSDDGLKCESGIRSFGVGEPDLTEITAKSPQQALEETISEDGADYVGLGDVAGSATELAADFKPAPADGDLPSSVQVFEYTDASGTVISRVQVEAVGDGRYFVGSVESCGDQK